MLLHALLYYMWSNGRISVQCHPREFGITRMCSAGAPVEKDLILKPHPCLDVGLVCESRFSTEFGFEAYVERFLLFPRYGLTVNRVVEQGKPRRGSVLGSGSLSCEMTREATLLTQIGLMTDGTKSVDGSLPRCDFPAADIRDTM